MTLNLKSPPTRFKESRSCRGDEAGALRRSPLPYVSGYSFREIALVVLLLCLGLGGAAAQTNLNSTAGVTREGESVQPEKLTATDVSTTSNLRPDRPERSDLPPEVMERIQDFRRDAREYLKQQEALKKQLEGANDEERALIRKQIEELRRQWLEKAREMRKEFRQRQAELLDKMPDYREVIDSARDAALQDAQLDAQTTRPGRDR